MATDTHPNAARHPRADQLAKAVRALRDEQKLSYRDVTKRGGPSRPVQSKYEAGDVPLNPSFYADVVRKYELAFEVPPRTLASILEGATIEGGVAAATQDLAKDLTKNLANRMPRERAVMADTFTVDAGLLRALIEKVQTIGQQMRDLPTSAAARAIQETVTEAQAIQVDLLLDQFRQPGETRETSGSDESGVSLRFGR
ncbi:hypothetical protein [Nocardia sp. NPDC057440]|uniref:hypothetical protein n=1 Tax=Nocardia sp. NPDC057440 TaxID=3346134 RepID=UPI00366E4532